MSKVSFYASEFREEHWKRYSKLFGDVEVEIEGVPQDIVNAIITLLGEENGIKWINMSAPCFDGKTVKELVKTEQGRKAVKAVILRLPK